MYERPQKMREDGIQPSPTVYTTAINACSQTADWKRALLLLVEMRTAFPGRGPVVSQFAPPASGESYPCGYTDLERGKAGVLAIQMGELQSCIALSMIHRRVPPLFVCEYWQRPILYLCGCVSVVPSVTWWGALIGVTLCRYCYAHAHVHMYFYSRVAGFSSCLSRMSLCPVLSLSVLPSQSSSLMHSRVPLLWS